MRVLVDTCVWSKVLRRKAPDKDLAGVLEDLIRDELSKDIAEAGRRLGITLHDHIVIGTQGHSSLSNLGLI